MSENKNTIILNPIGRVENPFGPFSDREEMRQSTSQILIDPALQEGLRGLAPGDRVQVLFYFDRSEGYELLQHPRGDPGRPKRGVFTLRSPRRPNPIGLTAVEVISVAENILTVRGLDAYHGTPVLDIKPVV